ncbi:MAG: hypothetical protein KA188_10205 [Leadbetterella sp.]|nr:hypothetical protein [Leadbetterella sp.]
MSLFEQNNLEGLRINADKKNWKAILNFVQNDIFPSSFFFFFCSERGPCLIIFTSKISRNDLCNIEHFLEKLPIGVSDCPEDLIFKNFEPNSVERIYKLTQNSNIEVPTSIIDGFTFEIRLSRILIEALNYNDFFIEEKNRINITIQLAFLALVRVDKNKLLSTIILNEENSQSLNIDQGLLDFFNEVQEIEKDETVEEWVKNWIVLNSNLQNLSEIYFVIESICQVLEIRSFAPKVKSTIISILKYIGEKSK